MLRPERGTNLLDSGSPIYEVYECADGGLVSIAPIEPKFRRELFALIGLDAGLDDDDLRPRLEARFRTKTRDEWCALLEGTDACFAPVLAMSEAPSHPHNRARGTFLDIDGVTQPGPAPRFGRSVPADPRPPEAPGAGGREALREWGRDDREIDRLAACVAVLLPGHVGS